MAFSASRFTKVKETRKARFLCYTHYIRAGAKVSGVKDILFVLAGGLQPPSQIESALFTEGLETVGECHQKKSQQCLTR